MNACYVNEANLDKPFLTLFTRRDVLPWEELCFSYTGYDSDEEVCQKLHYMVSLFLILLQDDEDQHVNNGDAVYAACLCGAKKCKGYMFK